MIDLISDKHDLKYLVSCLCCQARHYNIASASHKCDTIEELVQLRDYLREHKMPPNLERFFNELILRRQKNEEHDRIDVKD